MLAPGCSALLRVATADASGEQAVKRHAGLLWMLAQQQLAGSNGVAAVALPPDCPSWLGAEAHRLEQSGPQEVPSKGHALLLGPLHAVRQAAAVELLQQLHCQLAPLGAQHAQQDGDAAAPPVDEWLLPAADACHAAIQLLLSEHERQQRRLQLEGEDAAADSEEDEEEDAPEPLLLGNAAAAAGVAALVAGVCKAGAAAAARLAAEVDAAAAAARSAGRRGQQQPKQRGREEAYSAAQDAAAALVLCTQVLEPADGLLQSGCLPPAAKQQLEAACEELEGQAAAVMQLCRQLPPKHPLSAAVDSATAGAPALWAPAEEEEEGEDGTEEDGEGGSSGSEGPQPSSKRRPKSGGAREAEQGQRRRRRRMRDVRNPAVRAMLAEDGGAGAATLHNATNPEQRPAGLVEPRGAPNTFTPLPTRPASFLLTALDSSPKRRPGGRRPVGPGGLYCVQPGCEHVLGRA